ncbi:MAG: T9SS type A sorting domain-containing protein [Bacteroidales bacterium]
MGWGGSLDAWYNLPQGIPYNLTVFEGVIVNISFSQTEFAVSFSVVRNDQPLEGALISIAESGHVLTTDLNGTAAASLEPGNYSYVLEYLNEVLLEDVFVVESDDVTIEIILNSLNVAINSKALKVFPNPFSRLINVEVPSAVLSVKVFDLQGKQVYHRSPLTDSELLTIDMHDQPAGTYLLVVVLLNGDVFTGKIIQTLH